MAKCIANGCLGAAMRMQRPYLCGGRLRRDRRGFRLAALTEAEAYALAAKPRLHRLGYALLRPAQPLAPHVPGVNMRGMLIGEIWTEHGPAQMVQAPPCHWQV